MQFIYKEKHYRESQSNSDFTNILEITNISKNLRIQWSGNSDFRQLIDLN